MRNLIFVFLFLFSVNSFAHSRVLLDPNDPVTPWPLEVGRQPINANSFSGTWISAEAEPWILTVTPSRQEGTYHWELFLKSLPDLRSEGIVYLKDQYVIGLIQAPFVQQEFILMYLTDGKLHLKIGDGPAPRVEALFVRRPNEI